MGSASAARGSIIKAGAPESPGPQMAMGRIEHTLLDEERGFLPNRPKTIACNPTIPQKVTKVSICTKGPEPSRLESSDPMIEADAPSTGVLQVQIGMMCASHRG